MLDNDVVIKTSPVDINRYQIGEFYLKGISDRLFLIQCVNTDMHGTFAFDDIRALIDVG